MGELAASVFTHFVRRDRAIFFVPSDDGVQKDGLAQLSEREKEVGVVLGDSRGAEMC